MLNCQSIKFYSDLSQKRMTAVIKILGTTLVNRIIAFALFLLGVRRRHIAELLNMSPDTLKSFINRVLTTGIIAFGDGRKKASSFMPPSAVLPGKPSVFLEGEEIIADFGMSDRMLKIPVYNTLQVKTILLTMLNNGLITTPKAAEVLGYSTVHTSRLNEALHKGDVPALIDKRQGQKKDYLFSPEIKAELVQQFAANVVTRKPTSSRLISEQINKRCNLNLHDRSVRLHMKKLGLPKIAKSLPALVETFKKNSNQYSSTG